MNDTALRVSMAPLRGRLSLRARGDLSPLETALALTLPTRIGARNRAGEVEAICLGPDEWKIEAPDIAPLLAACAAVPMPHSLVDISAREVTLDIAGPRAAELLTLGIARDIDRIPVGEGRRTLCDGVTVLLWRDGAEAFRMDVWNSFAPHLMHLLEIGCRELAAEAA